MKASGSTRSARSILKRIRARMGWTQAEAASFLGVSKKAVESYEQGWRHVPDNFWKELITLVAVQHGYPRAQATCWSVMKCGADVRAKCFCARKMDGLFCWMTAANNCHRNHPELGKGMMTCLTCPVVQQFL